jgi:hypothetical protein
VAATTLTALNGVVVGYGALWFQIGDSANRDDYLVSSGGYAAASLLIASAVAGNLLRRGAAWFSYAGSVTAVLLGVAAVVSWSQGRVVEDRGAGISGVWDGVGGVVLLPWSWAIVVLLVLSVRHRLRTADTPPLARPTSASRRSV